MHRILILLFTLTCTLSPLWAQTQSRRSFHYELGLEFASGRDDLLIPLAFNGPGVMLGLGLEKPMGNWILDLDTRVKMDVVFNRFGHPGVIISLDFKPRITKQMFNLPYNIDLFMGPALPFEENNLFLFSWDDAHLYWFTIRGLNWDLNLTKTLKNDQQLSVGLSVPLISQVARPTVQRLEKQDPSLMRLGFYSPDGLRDYSTGSLASYQAVEMTLQLEQSNKRASWMIYFDFDHFAEPRDVWVLSTTLTYQRTFGRKGGLQ